MNLPDQSPESNVWLPPSSSSVVKNAEDYIKVTGITPAEYEEMIQASTESFQQPEVEERVLRIGSATLQLADKPTTSEKKRVWIANHSEDKGLKDLPTEYLPSSILQERRALKIAKNETHRKNLISEKSALEAEVYEIDPITGKSKWRNESGNLDHTRWSTRRRIKKAEKRHKKLTRKISDH